MSERTFTVGDAKPDPSLPTHCDHGVSLDDPCEICRDPNVHIANLEWRVVEAAVRFRRAETALWVESEVGTNESAAQAKTERPRAYIAFVDAVDALITLREKVENDSSQPK